MANRVLAILVAMQVAVSLLDARPVSPSRRDAPPPVPQLLGARITDRYTNKTMDQLIASTSVGRRQGPIGEMKDKDVMAPSSTVKDGMLAELDLRLTMEQYNTLYQSTSSSRSVSSRQKRKVVTDTRTRWPGAVVPYEIKGEDFTYEHVQGIMESINDYERLTCLRFREAGPTDTNKVRFQNGAGCNSALGMVGGTQVINLENPGCRYKGLYIHEIGHAIGLVHEHQRPDRDGYIAIIWDNVYPPYRQWFQTYSTQEVNTDVDYDLGSVMHYGITAFSDDGSSQTIRALDPSLEHTIGRVYLKRMTFKDIKAVNQMYNCAAKCPRNIPCNNGGYLDQHCVCQCPDGGSSCGQGPDTTKHTRPTIPTYPTTPGPSCRNVYDDYSCTWWATQGECKLGEKFMRKNCQKACKFCESSECSNVYENTHCEYWAKDDQCTVNPGWMSVFCRKSCRLC